jgi:hypothetical protein
MPDSNTEDIDLPGYAPWELPTQRKYMPPSLQRILNVTTVNIRVDQNAYDKHTTGKHPESHIYLKELDEVLERWAWIRPAPSGGAKWEVYIQIDDLGVQWVLVVLGASRGGINLVSIHLPRTGTVRNRLKQPGCIRRDEG